MTQEEIRALLNDLESDRVERTISTTNTDKFGQAICAFANDLPDNRLPGYLFLGVDDDGNVKSACYGYIKVFYVDSSWDGMPTVLLSGVFNPTPNDTNLEPK